MSVIRAPLNWYLRRVERRFLEKAHGPEVVRDNLERKARILFHAPRSVRMQDETLGGRPALQITQSSKGPTILYFHGGAYVFGSPQTHAAMIAALCKKADGEAFAVDYRKAPEHPFPSAIEDAEAAWLDLMDRGIDPKNTVIGGDSAGGGLALALLGVILQKGYAKPAGVFAFSPLTDMTFSGPSILDNADADVLLPANRIEELAALYLGDAPRDDPRASPLFAALDGAPHVYLTVGDTEVLRDDTLRLKDRLTEHAVDVTCKVEHDLPHVWTIFHNTLPEARRTLSHVANWIRQQTQPTGES